MHGQTSLDWAAENSHWKAVQLLLAAHAEVVDSKDDSMVGHLLLEQKALLHTYLTSVYKGNAAPLNPDIIPTPTALNYATVNAHSQVLEFSIGAVCRSDSTG